MEKITLTLPNKKEYFYEEAVKTLRTNIQFCGNNIRTIMMTSAMPGEGKSSTTFSLAESLTQIGKKVLLIDADIRKSVFTTRYQLGIDVKGLSQYLSGQITRDEVVYDTNFENLNMIFSGPYSPNPAELFEEDLFSELITWARENYDYIIIDSAPMGNLIDGAIIAKLCDGSVIVVESGGVSYRLVQKVKLQLERSDCRILGVVLNKVPMEQNGYYRKYYGKYGRYDKYGKYGGHYGRYDAYQDAYREAAAGKEQ